MDSVPGPLKADRSLAPGPKERNALFFEGGQGVIGPGGNGSLTDDEIKRARYVKQNYDITVKPEQIAWWRRENEYRADE